MFLIIALVLFVVAAVWAAVQQAAPLALIAAGLACLVAASVVPLHHLG